jgi:hypothetical protein
VAVANGRMGADENGRSKKRPGAHGRPKTAKGAWAPKEAAKGAWAPEELRRKREGRRHRAGQSRQRCMAQRPMTAKGAWAPKSANERDGEDGRESQWLSRARRAGTRGRVAARAQDVTAG